MYVQTLARQIAPPRCVATTDVVVPAASARRQSFATLAPASVRLSARVRSAAMTAAVVAVETAVHRSLASRVSVSVYPNAQTKTAAPMAVGGHVGSAH